MPELNALLTPPKSGICGESTAGPITLWLKWRRVNIKWLLDLTNAVPTSIELEKHLSQQAGVGPSFVNFPDGMLVCLKYFINFS